MEFWLKEGKHSRGKPGFPLWDASTWEPGARPRAILLWRLNDGLTSPLAPRIIVLYSGVNNLGVQKPGMDGFQGNVAIVKKSGEIYSPETTAIIVIPAHRTKRVAYMKTFRNCLLQHDFGENVHVLPSISSFREKTPALILGRPPSQRPGI